MNSGFILLPSVFIFFIYRSIAIRTMKSVISIEGDDYFLSRAPSFLGWDRSIAIMKIITDKSIPRAGYPNKLARSISIVRFLYLFNLAFGLISVVTFFFVSAIF